VKDKLMHHEEGPSGKSHWDDLAEQLGLPPEGTHTRAKMRETNEAKPPEPPIHREAPNLEARPEARAEEMEGTPEALEPPAEADTGSDDDRPARRRRGRRGGRRHREAREGADADRTRRRRSSGPGDKRGRRPRRSRDTEEMESESKPEREVDLEEAHDEDELEPQTSPAGPAEADDEEIEKISDWNIPSWAEIVTGLYRP
jgi:ribonuclease E